MSRARRVVGAVVIAVVMSVGAGRVFADDGEFVLVKPEICNHVTWDDWDYWYYGCYAF